MAQRDFGPIPSHLTPDEVNAVARSIYAKAAVVATLEPTTTDPTKFKPPSSLSSSVHDFGGRVPNGPLVQPAWLKTALARPLSLRSSVDPSWRPCRTGSSPVDIARKAHWS